MGTHPIAVPRTYQQEVAALAVELARLFRDGDLGLDALHLALAERCCTHPLIQEPDGCEQILACSAFADAALQVTPPPAGYSLRALATYVLQADVTLFLCLRCGVPLRPTSRC